MANWQPLAAATLVGSMPHKNRREVIDLILREMSEVPVWPQLPSFQPEQMTVQFLEGLPGIRQESGQTSVQTEWPCI